ARTQEGQKAVEDLRARFGPRESELQKLSEEIRELESRLQTQQRTLSDEARLQIVREVERKRKVFTRQQQDLQEDAQFAQQEHLQRIGEKLQKIVDRYARENSLALVLNDSDGTLVVFATAAVDITEPVVRLYDQTHSMQPAAGGSNPPASQPPPPRKPN
ncbi:MAG: OmpH family outer membrane protein, partial [Acidobacteria bacterium]|nr:OmpH family outer membrane protein [Acidobacteriota bacterium]